MKYMEGYVKSCVEEAQEAFWAKVADLFPDVKTGDMDPWEVNLFDQACERAIAGWLSMNGGEVVDG